MKKISLLCLILIAFGCKKTPAPETPPPTQTAPTDTAAVEQYRPPAIPPLIVEPERQFDYLIENYWANFNFSDTTYTPTPEVTEQAWVEYLGLLSRAPLPKSQAAIRSMMRQSAKGSKKLLQYFIEMAGKYLYEPNSPARNEELYIPVLEVITQLPALDETEKMLPRYRLKQALKNRINAKALDFRYIDYAGKSGSLYQIQAQYLLLFFNEPGCPSCKEHIEAISKSEIINQLTAEQRLRILSVYADKNEKEWKKHYGSYPPGWLNGYDRTQTISDKYNLQAIPTLYLLDKDKTVILKDETLPKIENYLRYITANPPLPEAPKEK